MDCSIRHQHRKTILKVKWVIEDFEPDNKFGALADEVRRQGMDCETIRYLPLQSGSYDVFKKRDCVLFQGSLNLATQLQTEKEWVPGPWLSVENYQCTIYYAHLGKYLFNDPYIMLPRAEVKRNLSWLYDEAFGAKLTGLFFRPSSGMKPFTAGVCDPSSFESFWKWVEEFSEPHSIVVISPIKKILGEWRFVCADHQIITGCQYRKDGSINYAQNYPAEAKALADQIAGEKFQPDPMFIIDICQGESGRYYLLEINSFSCGGLYACEMEPIVKKASEIALREWEDLFGDSQ